MANNKITPLPVRPVQNLPKITEACASGHLCYHREYWTDITSATQPTQSIFQTL
uniref:Uncharacterized protein n=1 Tax=Arundo donax TaxID=35708 RepID=A0A0A8ZNP2_ARUDO